MPQLTDTYESNDQGYEVDLAARKLLVAVDHDHAVLLGQRQRILDRGVAGTDDDDRLVLVFLWIVELIPDDGEVLAGDTCAESPPSSVPDVEL